MYIMPFWFLYSNPNENTEHELRSYDKIISSLMYEWDRASVELPEVDTHFWNKYNEIKDIQNKVIEGHCLLMAAGF